MATVLKALLQQRHLQTVSAFNREYDRIATRIEPDVIGCGPKKAQFYRWLSGNVSSLPYPHHCRILTEMFPGWSASELFAPLSGNEDDLRRDPAAPNRPAEPSPTRTADVEAAFASRLDFVQAMPPRELFRSAQSIDLLGISLNILCQQYADTDILRLLESGTTIRCLFLDPTGRHIVEREQEEDHPPGTLTSLTQLNIQVLRRVQRLMTPDTPGRIEIRTYDAPVRFNITIVDNELCVMQPYLPRARGVESPTFVSRRSLGPGGIFDTFATVFESMWTEGRDGN